MSSETFQVHQAKKNPRTQTLDSLSAADDSDLLQFIRASPVTRIRAALAAAGVTMTGAHCGTMKADSFAAEVQLEPVDVVHVRRFVSQVDPPHALLERGAGADGNVRFAEFPSGRHIVAETRIDGVAHLPDSFQLIRRGFTHLLDGTAPVAASSTGKADLVGTLKAAVEQAGWPREDVIESTKGCELHTKLEGVRTSVEVALGPDSIVVRRAVLTGIPEGAGCQAVAHQALALNARLRFCRLAIQAGRLQVETRLDVALIDGDWLRFTVRSVTGAARAVEPELRMLAEEPAVAEAYVRMFPGATEESPAHET